MLTPAPLLGAGPVCVQLFGANPEHFYRSAHAMAQLGFAGIDLNFGCPDKSVVGRQGAGSALIGEPELAKQIVLAAQEGARDGSVAAGLSAAVPVSVKTRIGLERDIVEEWVSHLVVCAV